jgi:DNA recombination protein RmuC
MDKVNKRKEEIDQAKQDFELKFKDLANTILEANSTKLKRENEEILKPLRDKLTEFQAKVESTNEKSVETNATLLAQIKQLTELNKTVSEETQNLTKALK